MQLKFDKLIFIDIDNKKRRWILDFESWWCSSTIL